MRRIDGVAVVALLLAACSDPQGLPPLVVDSIAVAPADRVLALGDTMRLTGYPMTADGVVLGSVEVAWRSADESLATVTRRGPHAVVEARGVGTVRILAEAAGEAGWVDVRIVPQRLPVVRVEITPGGGDLRIGGNQRLEALLYAEDGSILGGREVQWASSSMQKLTVTSHGNPAIAVLVAHAQGEVVVSALCEGAEGAATFHVLSTAASR